MRTIVEYGLANAVAATALAVFACFVGRIVRRPAVRNALWLLVLVRLLLPPIWTIPLPISPASQSNAPSTAVVDSSELPTHSDELIDPIAFDLAALVATDSQQQADAVVETPTSAPAIVASAAATVPTPSSTASSIQFGDQFFAWLIAVWLAGSLWIFGRSIVRIVRFHRALRDALPAPESMQREALELAQGMKLRHCPRILLVPGRVWPSLWMPGPFARHARLIMPAGLLPLLDTEQRAAVMAHELSHLRRGDPWVRWLELLVCGVYWWHPLLSWFRRNLRESEEACCDMWVVAATSVRKSYATALVETAAYLGGPGHSASPVLASGVGPVRNLQRRVTMIMRATWPARLTRPGPCDSAWYRRTWSRLRAGHGTAGSEGSASRRRASKRASEGSPRPSARTRARRRQQGDSAGSRNTGKSPQGSPRSNGTGPRSGKQIGPTRRPRSRRRSRSGPRRPRPRRSRPRRSWSGRSWSGSA